MYSAWHEKVLLYRLYDQRDADAFGQLYDRYAPKLYRYLSFKVGTAPEAEDLTAEVFLKTWEYVRRQEAPIVNFRAFVYRLARNAVVDHYRRRAEREHLADEAALEAVPEPVERSVAALVSRSSDLALVERALRALKDEYREVVILRYIEGLSPNEISRVLDKSAGSVRVTLHRALGALREEVQKVERHTSSA
jgi:RNA polymerase sigma-70 factor (ECF subfamily)